MTSFFTTLKNRISHLLSWVRAHKVWSAVMLVIVLLGGYAVYAHYQNAAAGTQYVVTAARHGTLTASVTGSGQVAANQTLELTPKSSGEVTYVGVKAGDTVSAGTVIARVDDTTAAESLRDAEASLVSAQITYQQAVTSAGTSKTKASGDAFSAASSAITDASSVLKDLNSTLYQISSIPEHQNQLGIDAFASVIGGSEGDAARSQIKSAYQAAEASYQAALTAAIGISPTSSDSDIEHLATAAYQAATDAASATSLTHTTMTAVNDKLTRNDVTIPASFTGKLSTIANDDTTMTNAVSNVYTAKTSFESSTATLGNAGSTPLDIQSAQLALTKAENAVADAKTTLANYVVVAPFDGTIAKVDVQVHDQASGAVATLITNEEYADLSLNEVDAAKVQNGQKATLTFDAVDGLTIAGTVAEIDSVGTVSNGVVTYDAKIAFDTQDARVKPGMTVDAVITTSSVDDAIIVPSSAVTTVGGKSYVQVVTTGAPALATTTRAFGRYASTTSDTATTSPRMETDSTSSSTRAFAGGSVRGGAASTETVDASSVTVTRVPVEVGISNDTETQIVQGLVGGQLVVTATKTGTTASATTSGTTRTTGGFGAGTARPAGGFGGGAAVFRAGG
ncbi:MAG TPA: HlyD family efflux transporter periplasmic adaptor subunit [Candidatus Paceibacterota bacterium]|nr:HlyD family efflux transporter periplasmic adaptor subunit [Candidatus Paceibacterota bacterium]